MIGSSETFDREDYRFLERGFSFTFRSSVCVATLMDVIRRKDYEILLGSSLFAEESRFWSQTTYSGKGGKSSSDGEIRERSWRSYPFVTSMTNGLCDPRHSPYGSPVGSSVEGTWTPREKRLGVVYTDTSL